jgi:hypothetical protein
MPAKRARTQPSETASKNAVSLAAEQIVTVNG